jgi:hypothetical protein
MAEIWGAALAAAGALGGAAMSSRAARQSSKDMAATQGQLTTRLGQSDITGPGGMTSTVFGDGNGGSINLGDLGNARNFLTQLGTNSAFNAQSGGMPPGVLQALQQLQGGGSLPGMPNTSQLDGNMSEMLARTFGQVGQSQNFNQVRDDTLGLLRDQARPFEQRAFNNLQNDQFATGRLGTSGGGMQTEAFARGLAQADTSRQLSAIGEARNVQQNEDSLLQSAFGRFAQTAGMANDLTQQRFGNSMLLNETGFGRQQQNFGNQITAAQLPMQMQGQQLQLALQALQGQGFLNDQGMQQFQAALAASQAGANARIGSGSNVAALAGARAQMPTSNDIWGQALTGIAGRIGGNEGVMGALGGLFGGSSPKMPPPDPTIYGPTRAVK